MHTTPSNFTSPAKIPKVLHQTCPFQRSSGWCRSSQLRLYLESFRAFIPQKELVLMPFIHSLFFGWALGKTILIALTRVAVPIDWCLAVICPMHKKGHPGDASCVQIRHRFGGSDEQCCSFRSVHWRWKLITIFKKKRSFQDFLKSAFIPLCVHTSNLVCQNASQTSWRVSTIWSEFKNWLQVWQLDFVTSNTTRGRSGWDFSLHVFEWWDRMAYTSSTASPSEKWRTIHKQSSHNFLVLMVGENEWKRRAGARML